MTDGHPSGSVTRLRELVEQWRANAHDSEFSAGQQGIFVYCAAALDVELEAAALAPAVVPSVDGLHNAIMNIPCAVTNDLRDAEMQAYRRGHMDARHAAAELVATAPPVVAPSRPQGRNL